MRYFIELAYDGTNYHGWQVQPNAPTVQEVMTDALRKLTRDANLDIMGCGRTDTGVHSDYFVCHFDTDVDFINLSDGGEQKSVFKLNSILPPDVAAFSIQPVEPKLHSRFSALSRTYHYRLTMDKQPMLRNFTFRPFFPLNFDAMNDAAQILLSVSDFTSFSKLGTQVKTNICDVTVAHWFEESPGRMTFEIKANRFLRNMVRAVVGTLFEVGKGKMSLDQFRDVIERHDRCAAGSSVSAAGLSLVDIAYPEGRGFVPKARKVIV